MQQGDSPEVSFYSNNCGLTSPDLGFIYAQFLIWNFSERQFWNRFQVHWDTAIEAWAYQCPFRHSPVRDRWSRIKGASHALRVKWKRCCTWMTDSSGRKEVLRLTDTGTTGQETVQQEGEGEVMLSAFLAHKQKEKPLLTETRSQSRAEARGSESPGKLTCLRQGKNVPWWWIR